MNLHKAARRGDVAAIGALIAQGVDVNAALDDPSIVEFEAGPAPLHYAAAAGHAAAARLLLEAGADVDAVMVDGREFSDYTPLLYAAEKGHAQVVLVLLEAGADANEFAIDVMSDPEVRTPLVMSAQQGRLDIVEMLIQHGARVDWSTAQTVGKWAPQEIASFLRKVWQQRVDARIREFMEEAKGSYVGNRHELFEQISPILFWFADQGVEALVALLLRPDSTVAAAAVKVGESNQVEYDPRPLFEAAEKRGATKMLFGHNHPNASSPRPSDEDVFSCLDLHRECEEKGIDMADDVVVCRTAEGRTLKSVTQTTRFRTMIRGY
jgi:hypothetical protein